MKLSRMWLAGLAFVVVLIAASVVSTSALAQTTPRAGDPGVGVCPASGGMMQGPGRATGDVDAMLAAHSARIDAAVAAGWLTQPQADAMTAAMRARLDAGFGPGAGWYGMMGGR